MAGLIEHQQGIVHSSLIEKIQQVQREHLQIYQQYAAGVLKEQHTQQRRTVVQTDGSRDIRVVDRDKKKNVGHARSAKKRPPDGHEKSDDPHEGLLDIIA